MTSLPLPPMRKPDIRQRIIEAVLDTAAAAGVDDVHLIAALALHRRMTEQELRHAVGDRVYDAFAPSGTIYNHDAEDLGRNGSYWNNASWRRSPNQQKSRRKRLDCICEYKSGFNGWRLKSTATGLSGYTALRHHHNPQTMVESKSFMDQENSELHKSNWRQGKVLKESGIQIFQIETKNNNTFGYDGPLAMLQKREWEWTFKDHIISGHAAGLKRMSPASKRKSFQGWYSPYEITSVQAGEVEAVHKVTTENVYKQHLVQVEGQTDILTMGLPYICPYNVNSVMNPILVACLGLGYFFNMYKGKPLVRKGGVVIMTHPTPWEFHPVHQFLAILILLRGFLAKLQTPL